VSWEDLRTRLDAHGIETVQKRVLGGNL
jgi:hypothetical protein